MSNFENKLLKQIINKLVCNDEPDLFEKSTELIRLLDLKSSKTVSLIGDYGKIVICVNLASSQLGTTIDMDTAYTLSGLRKSAYINNKRIIEKLLDLSVPLGIKEICTQLNLNEITSKALQLFDIFKMKNNGCCNDVDLKHPQYSAMAVYQACKLFKKEKIYKTKIRQFSYLKLIQWNKLEQQWDKILVENKNVNKSNTISDDNENKDTDVIDNEQNCKKQDDDDNDKIENYEIWKRRMLIFAELQLDVFRTDV